MAAVDSISMYEEKLSPKLDDSYMKENEDEGEKFNNSIPFSNIDIKGDGEGKTDAVLDEIAAKVKALPLEDDEENPIPNKNSHAKCMDTVREQGKTIDTLVNQLRMMFEEYTEMNSEREYLEELNEAYLRCLEFYDGRLQIESDNEDEENVKNLEGKKDMPTIIITNADDDQPEISKSKETATGGAEDKSESVASGQTPILDDEPHTSIESEVKSGLKSSSDADTTTESKPDEAPKKKVKGSELLRLNRILLRELFESRHQLEQLKEEFRYYLYSEDASQSECDTETDDDHACSQCMQDTPDQDDIASEEYENNESEFYKIEDESDTE